MTTQQDSSTQRTTHNSVDPRRKVIRITLAALLVMLAAFVALGIQSSHKLLEQVEVEIRDVHLKLLGKDKKPLRFSLLNPLGILESAEKGYTEITLEIEIINQNAIDIQGDYVEYTVALNGEPAGKGRFPEVGKPAITLVSGEPYIAEIPVRVKTSRVFREGLRSVMQGGRVEIEIEGEARASVWGIGLTRPFQVKRTENLKGLLPDLPFL